MIPGAASALQSDAGTLPQTGSDASGLGGLALLLIMGGLVLLMRRNRLRMA